MRGGLVGGETTLDMLDIEVVSNKVIFNFSCWV